MKARVHIFYKDSVFDPQGSTVEHSLRTLGFKQVNRVRIGKVVDVEIEARNREEARKLAESMCEKLLVNPVMESFQIEIAE